MDRKTVLVETGQLKSRLIPAAAVFYTLSALLGIVGIVLLFDPEYAAILVQDRIDGGIQLASSLSSWYLIDTGITLLNFFCPAVMSAALWTVIRGRTSGGMNLISHFLQLLLWILYGSSVAALVVYLVKILLCMVSYLRYNEGAYLIYELLICEGLMGLQAWLLWMVIRKFLREGGDCVSSITYTLVSGKLDSMSIPSFPGLGLGILGIALLILACNNFTTIMLVRDYSGNYYQLQIAAHPGQYLAAASMAAGAIGNFLLSLYLRKYNRICERIRFRANRLSKNP